MSLSFKTVILFNQMEEKKKENMNWHDEATEPAQFMGIRESLFRESNC